MECHALTHEKSECRHSYLPCHIKKSDTGNTPKTTMEKIQKELLPVYSDLLQKKCGK